MARERTYRTEAIIMRRSDHGEADRLLTLFSRDRGKIKAVAKGARKPQSRKTGHVELFMRSQFLIASARSFDIITQAELLDPFRPLSTDLMRMTYASYISELLDNFTPEEERNSALFALFNDGLGWFANGDNLMLAARYYELRLLSLAGFQPQFFYCVASGEPIENEDQYFSADLGGFLRPEQRHTDPRCKRASAAAVKLLRFLQTRSWDAVHTLQLRPELHTELEALMHYYLSHLLERRLKSVDFLSRLKREARQFSNLQ